MDSLKSKAGSSGIVEYYIDNYENLTPNQLTATHFDKKKYVSADIENGDIVEEKAPIYKTISHEQWQLVNSVIQRRILKVQGYYFSENTFQKDNTTVTTNFEIKQEVIIRTMEFLPSRNI